MGPAEITELPHVCVLIAPCGVSLNAWLLVAGPLLPNKVVTIGAYYFATHLLISLLIVLSFARRLAGLPWTPGAAAYTFPFQIVGISTLRWLTTGFDGVAKELSSAEQACGWLIFVVAALPSLFALVTFVVLLFQGKFLIRQPSSPVSADTQSL